MARNPDQHAPSDGMPSDEREESQSVIDAEAAEIDARDPDAPEQIAELIEDADDLELPTPEPSEVPDPRE